MVQRGDIPAGGNIRNRGLLYSPFDDLCGFVYIVLDDTNTDTVYNKKGYVVIHPHSVAVLVKSRDAMGENTGFSVTVKS